MSNINKQAEQYATVQKQFWDTPTIEDAMFGRVDLFSNNSLEVWEQLAEKHVTKLFSNYTPNKESRILEIGCGVGRIIKKIHQKYPYKELLGLDISAKMVEYAKQYTEANSNQNIKLHEISGYDFPIIQTSSIDFVYSLDVMIHIFDINIITSYIKEANRSLKKGGVFKFNVRHFNLNKSFGNSLGGLYAKFLYSTGIRKSYTHTWDATQEAEFNGNFFSVRDIKQIVQEVGFDITDIHVYKEFENSEELIWIEAVKN